MKKPTHVSLGNFNVDITLYVEGVPNVDQATLVEDVVFSVGGAATNYSIATSIYGHLSYLISVVSKNPLSLRFLERVKKMGVNVDYVSFTRGKPGYVVILVNHMGERRMLKYVGVNAKLRGLNVPEELLDQASLVHLASVPVDVAVKTMDQAYRRGLIVTYDPGVFVLQSRSGILENLSKVNVLFLNKHELQELSRGDPLKLLKHGVDLIVVKKGARGALLIQQGGLTVIGYSKPIKRVVNSTGAGDAFNAFFNAAFLDYRDPVRALQYGLAAGTLKTSCKGSYLCWDRAVVNQQLKETYVEAVKEQDFRVLLD